MSEKRWIKGGGGMYATIPTRGPQKGEETYHARIWVKEERRFRHFFLGTTLKAAKKKMGAIYSDPVAALDERLKKQQARAAEKPALKFKDLVEIFLAEYRSRGGSDHYASRSKAWLAFFGPDKEQDRPGWFVKDIDFAAVEAFREFRRRAIYRVGKKGKSLRSIGDSTLRKDLLSLSTLFRWAMRRGLAERNPVQNVTKPPEPDREVTVLSPDEETALLQKADAETRVMIALFLASGMRRGEGLSLKWSQVDRAGGALLIHKSKTGKARAIPFNEDLTAALDLAGKVKRVRLDQEGRVAEVPSEFVLHDAEGKPLEPGAAARLVDSAMEAAGIQKARGCTFNLLRHTFGSRRAAAGVPMAVVAALMGNTATVCEDHYIRFSPGHLQEAMNRKPGPVTAPQSAPRSEGDPEAKSAAAGSGVE